jgi:hypothetical protein
LNLSVNRSTKLSVDRSVNGASDDRNQAGNICKNLPKATQVCPARRQVSSNLNLSSHLRHNGIRLFGLHFHLRWSDFPTWCVAPG